ncbi:Putative uncharacterized protein [Taphrina deformans PYCC 5710]|uniref:Translin n=1 Tax=Taphrina deformans (strain PYCC 5710 / ATCC 11124 / CBS 356.35 / IMI 108563 / JCM 9778 / NBRC 8474) TaxID=1097556 RepID=R4X9T5_TAPDE|nr:Putative uncharacterized protein [Taphrina deformans PYCC 5710]|eukprot:CCG82237.1 Putative uncharacterized protein [Taphrina deformans PYCC 5710]
MSETQNGSVIDPSIFLRLQESIDRDAAFKDEIREVTNELDRIHRQITFVLAQAHSVPSDKLSSTLEGCRTHFEDQKVKLAALAKLASQMPYYKFNFLFTNQLQNASYTAVFAHWLGCDLINGGSRQAGTLLSLEEVGTVLTLEVNSIYTPSSP